MKRSTIGALVASTVVGLVGAAPALAESHGDAKGCYRTQCGKSVKGHEGKCGGTKVDAITDEAACKAAGGAWTTAADAKQYEKNEEG
jgi:uncharacterized low-complexity protein